MFMAPGSIAHCMSFAPPPALNQYVLTKGVLNDIKVGQQGLKVTPQDPKLCTVFILRSLAFAVVQHNSMHSAAYFFAECSLCKAV